MSCSACRFPGCSTYGTVHFNAKYYCNEHVPNGIAIAPGSCIACGRQDGSHEFICKNICARCGRKHCVCLNIKPNDSFFFFSTFENKK